MRTKFSIGHVTEVIPRYGLVAGAVVLAEDVAAPGKPGHNTPADIAVYVRAELGVRPDHEVIYLRSKLRATVATWWISRGEEGSTPADWPAGTPLVPVAADADPQPRLTIHPVHALPASSVHLDLRWAYRRLRIEDEILWSRDLMLERRPRNPPGPLHHLDVWGIPRLERGKEGTVATEHAAGAELTFLAPGEV